MKAVYAAGTDYDNPLSQLKVGELDTPETKPFWSTIHVAAASVNHHDIWSLQGVGLSAEQTPMILGTDASGVLDEDIPVRKGLKAGAEVVLYTFVGTDGAGVMPGERRTILSEKYAGTMAEITQVPSANVFAKPANLTLDEAAALGTSWLTAYSLLFTSANVKPGDTVLVQGAGGGVFHEFEQSCEIVTRTHGVALHANVLEEDAGQFGSRLVSCGGSADGDGAAGAYGFDGMAPGGRADRFDDGVDLMRQSRAGFEGGVGSDGDRAVSFLFAA